MIRIMALSLFLVCGKVGFVKVENIIHCTYKFCASVGGNYVKCIVEGSRYIVNATVFNRTSSWSCDGVILSGYYDNFVWVDHGCHAYFDVCAVYKATTPKVSTSVATTFRHTTSRLTTTKPTSTKSPQQITTTETRTGTTLFRPATAAFMASRTTASTAVKPTTMVSGSTSSSVRNIKAEEATTINAKGNAGISSNTAIIAGALGAGLAFLAVGIMFSKFMLSQNAVSRVSPFVRDGRPEVQERGTSMSPEVSEIAKPVFDKTKLVTAL